MLELFLCILKALFKGGNPALNQHCIILWLCDLQFGYDCTDDFSLKTTSCCQCQTSECECVSDVSTGIFPLWKWNILVLTGSARNIRFGTLRRTDSILGEQVWYLFWLCSFLCHHGDDFFSSKRLLPTYSTGRPQIRALKLTEIISILWSEGN